ncbi:MAG: 4-(cytidine 5'-diphospho)-2-C-methyl-D-erythritol kinase [Prevotella sp.]
MITFPIAKINLGLNIVEKRSDGYHNLETVFYPLPIHDALEVHEMDSGFPSSVKCDIKVSNMVIEGDEQRNLVVKAYNLLSEQFDLPRLHVHLHKFIPSQAGLGGGSSDAAYMLTLLNREYHLGLQNEELICLAKGLGADCPFFVQSQPSYATGIGEQLTPINLDLSGYHIAVIKPNIAVSTAEAFRHIIPEMPAKKCADIVQQPIDTWKEELLNDFERSIFMQHPELQKIKDMLYDTGAAYASMSGSGSSIYGIFHEQPQEEMLKQASEERALSSFIQTTITAKLSR